MSGDIQSKLRQFSEVIDAFPEVRYIGDPVLRTPTQKVNLQEGIEIGNKLAETLKRYRTKVGYGRGMAAPQIGIAKSVFVTFLNDTIQVYINPKIITRSSEKNIYRELCLSCGFLWGKVVRPAILELVWTDNKGQHNQEKFEGLIARLIQHEHDHLEGKVNLDRAESGTIEFVLSDPLNEQLTYI